MAHLSLMQEVYYYRSFGSKSPLILAHGIADDGLCWSPVAEVLSGENDVIMVDARGHRKSDAPEDGYDYETMAMELAGLATGLNLDKPALLGHSMGTATVLILAGLFPNLPRVILLEDPPPIWKARTTTPEENEHRAYMIAWINGFIRKTREELLTEGRQVSPTWSNAEFEPWADAKHRFSPKIIGLFHQVDDIHIKYATLLNRVICPVLLITADREQNAVLADDDVSGLQKLIPHLEIANIPGAGHNIRREQFSRYLEVVQSFLSESGRTLA